MASGDPGARSACRGCIVVSMNVSATAAAGAPTADAPAAAPRSEPVATFAKVLEGQQRSATQTIALRDLLASMPPMMAEQIQRSVPGGKPPLDAVDALFKATKSGEFVPDAQQIAARSCLIATTARAADAYDSAEEMWQGMRDLLGAGAPLHDAVHLAVAEVKREPAPALVTSKQQADAILAGPLPTAQLNWWETALRFLIDYSKVARAATATATLATTPAAAPASVTPAADPTAPAAIETPTTAAPPPQTVAPVHGATPIAEGAVAAASRAAAATHVPSRPPAKVG